MKKAEWKHWRPGRENGEQRDLSSRWCCGQWWSQGPGRSFSTLSCISKRGRDWTLLLLDQLASVGTWSHQGAVQGAHGFCPQPSWTSSPLWAAWQCCIGGWGWRTSNNNLKLFSECKCTSLIPVRLQSSMARDWCLDAHQQRGLDTFKWMVRHWLAVILAEAWVVAIQWLVAASFSWGRYVPNNRYSGRPSTVMWAHPISTLFSSADCWIQLFPPKSCAWILTVHNILTPFEHSFNTWARKPQMDNLSCFSPPL